MSSESEDFALAQLLAREEIARASINNSYSYTAPMIDLTKEQDEEDGRHSKVSAKKRGFARDSIEEGVRK